jgi:Zn finger protein HypA/HybF involved in hydrogenase expression
MYLICANCSKCNQRVSDTNNLKPCILCGSKNWDIKQNNLKKHKKLKIELL